MGRSRPSRATLLTSALLAIVLAAAVGIAPVIGGGAGANPFEPIPPGPADELLLDRTLDRLLGEPSDPLSLTGYWRSVFRSLGTELVPPSIAAYQAGDRITGACAASAWDAAGDARYCPEDHTIRFDRTWLASLHRAFGPGPVAAVLAHEWGHLVQAATATPLGPLRAELQADCYAGMYLRHLVRAGILPDTSFATALHASYLVPQAVASPSWKPRWVDEAVHGPWTARRQALGVGYDTGSMAWCRGYDGWSSEPPIELGGLTTLTPGPVLNATVDARGTIELRYPSASVRVSRVGGRSDDPAAVRGDLLRASLGDAAAVDTTEPGAIDLPGWPPGEAPVVAFEVGEPGRPQPDAGVAAVRFDPTGTGQLFVARAPVVGTRQAAVEEATRALRALLWGLCDLRARDATNCPDPPVTEPTPSASPAPSATASPSAIVDSSLSRRELEQQLVSLAPAGIRDRCRPYRQRGEFDPFAGGAVAAVDCSVGRGGVDNFALFQFPDAPSLEAYYRERADGVGLVADSGGCLDGTRGETAWERGRVACWVTRTQRPRLAHVRWTDEGTLTYGVLNGTSNDLGGLVSWWSSRQ